MIDPHLLNAENCLQVWPKKNRHCCHLRLFSLFSRWCCYTLSWMACVTDSEMVSRSTDSNIINFPSFWARIFIIINSFLSLSLSFRAHSQAFATKQRRYASARTNLLSSPSFSSIVHIRFTLQNLVVRLLARWVFLSLFSFAVAQFIRLHLAHTMLCRICTWLYMYISIVIYIIVTICVIMPMPCIPFSFWAGMARAGDRIIQTHNILVYKIFDHVVCRWWRARRRQLELEGCLRQ